VSQSTDGPGNPGGDVVIRIRALLPTLSAAEARVAVVIQEDPSTAAGQTISELARQAATSTATVVRTARRLGFDGYPQLRLALAAHRGNAALDGLPLGADIADGDTTSVVLRKLADFESEQLRVTAELLDPGTLDAIAGQITTARRIDLYGLGASGLVAQDLDSKLSRLGLNVRCCTERDAAMVSASLLGANDLAIAISHSGESRIREALTLAAGTGAHTAAITGVPRSSLAAAADHVLLTAGREFGFRSAAMASRTGQLMAIDALFVVVVQALPQAHESLRRTYAGVASNPAGRSDKGLSS